MPAELQHHNKGLINLINNDNECFRWCHIRYLEPKDNPQIIKILDKLTVDQLNYNGVEFPVTVKDYAKIGPPKSININVYGYENKEFYPVYVSIQNNEDMLSLLVITEDEKTHYVLIKDFNRLLFNETKHEHGKHFCMHCLQCFSSEDVLTRHKTNCIVINGEQAIRMPRKGKNTLQFQIIIDRYTYHLLSTPVLRLNTRLHTR